MLPTSKVWKVPSGTVHIIKQNKTEPTSVRFKLVHRWAMKSMLIFTHLWCTLSMQHVVPTIKTLSIRINIWLDWANRNRRKCLELFSELWSGHIRPNVLFGFGFAGGVLFRQRQQQWEGAWATYATCETFYTSINTFHYLSLCPTIVKLSWLKSSVEQERKCTLLQ